MDGALVHRRVTPSIKYHRYPHIHAPGWTEATDNTLFPAWARSLELETSSPMYQSNDVGNQKTTIDQNQLNQHQTKSQCRPPPSGYHSNTNDNFTLIAVNHFKVPCFCDVQENSNLVSMFAFRFWAAFSITKDPDRDKKTTTKTKNAKRKLCNDL